jgi:HlyD family secretion protein
VVPTADRQKATVLVRIGFNELDPRILPDMGVKVTFLREDAADAGPAARPTALVPKSAVRSDNGASHVFVVTQSSVERRAVQTGGTDGDRLEVTAGLSAGERVVVAPPAGLAAGVPVVIKQ